jgi:hypothetical protein
MVRDLEAGGTACSMQVQDDGKTPILYPELSFTTVMPSRLVM